MARQKHSNAGIRRRRITATASSRRLLKNDTVRVWWPPTKDRRRSGYSGAWWFATVIEKVDDNTDPLTDYYSVRYAADETVEIVSRDLMEPMPTPGVDMPDFGDEKDYKTGDLVEFIDEHAECHYVALVKAATSDGVILQWPFHDDQDESVKSVEHLRIAHRRGRLRWCKIIWEGSTERPRSLFDLPVEQQQEEQGKRRKC